MIRVRMNTTIAGPNGRANAGSIYTCEEAEAEALVEAGYGKIVLDTKESAAVVEPPKMEVAAAAPSENASANKNGSRKRLAPKEDEA